MSAPGVVASKEDLAIVERLRAGDELAFMMLVEQHTAAMLRIARMYVSSRAVAEDVVAEAWLGVVRGIERFEGRSSQRYPNSLARLGMLAPNLEGILVQTPSHPYVQP